jgi:hypothetical protein
MAQATEILHQRLEQKLALLAQLRDLGLHQAVLIDSGDMSQLLRLLAAKQRLLVALQSVERQLDCYRDEDPDERIWLSPDHRRRCGETAARCEELLRAIVAQERESELQMCRYREETASQLNAVHSAAEVRQAYFSEPARSIERFDLTEG